MRPAAGEASSQAAGLYQRTPGHALPAAAWRRLVPPMVPPLRLRGRALLGTLLLFAQAAEAAESATSLLRGAIDLHCHSGPDTVPRSVNDIELARAARAAGLRALVIKNHFTDTADRAQLAQFTVGGGIEVFGGIVLNRAVGGLNAEAVRRMATMDGRRGKMVWLPTFDAENAVRSAGEERPFVPVVAGGKPVAALTEVFAVMVEHGLVLATGHASVDESLVIVAAARAVGIRHVVVTHALFPAVRASNDQLIALARLGAWIEFAWLMHAPPAIAPTGSSVPLVPLERGVAAIRAVGAAQSVLSSDFGQAAHRPPPEGLKAFLAALQAAGVSSADLDTMVRRNPAHVLGLQP